MRVTKDTSGTVVAYTRTILIEDGPTLDLGKLPFPTYHEGTVIQVEEVRLRWTDKSPLRSVRVFGHLTDGTGKHRYEDVVRLDAAPQWLKDLIK